MTINSKPENADRDRAIARLVRDDLAHRDLSEYSGCPETEVLAAYADRGLSVVELEQWEHHFSSCRRCQKMLALLAASAEEGVPQGLPRTAALDPFSPIQKHTNPWVWRWTRLALVPALGAMAAAVIWFVLVPTTPHVTSIAENRAAPSAPLSDQGEIAQAQPRQPEEFRAQAAVTPSQQPGPASDSLRANQGERQEALATVPAVAPRLPSESADSAPANQPSSAKETRSAQTGQAQATTDKLSAAAAQPAQRDAEAKTSSSEPAPQSGIPQASNRITDLTAARAQLFTFAAPDRSVLWRVAAGGHIERSSDQGRTWLAQNSGVTTDLLAGVAVSREVAWVVGRAGAILRTTDGTSWQRVMSPDGLSPDWTGVRATDGLHVTIVSSDQRRFATADGGRTWTAQ